MAPKRVIPLIAFEPLINGVCNVGGTFVIISIPTNTARIKHRESVIAIISGITAMRTLDEWLADLEPAGVPCGPINTLDRVFTDKHVLARGMRVKIPHSLGIDIEHAGNPIKFSESPIDYPSAAPLLGEHSDEILKEWLQLDENEISNLRTNNII